MIGKPTPPSDWEHAPLNRFANVDDTTSGFTELRTHGVSGPSPSSVLKYPEQVVNIVAGNVDSGFWRRWRLGGDFDDVPNKRHIEAFCWGGLTSRASFQALWLLLLPFSLVNIAHWMLPPITGKPVNKKFAWVAVSLLRVLALSLTVTIALAGAEITMDLAAWQCGANDLCREKLGPWGLVDKLGDRTGLRVAAAGAVLSLMLVLLLLLGRRNYRPLREASNAPSPLVQRFVKGQPGGQPILGDASFWAVDRSMRWLRGLHAVVWCAVTGAAATGALVAMTSSTDDGHGLGQVLLWTNIGLLAVAFAAVIPQYFGRGGNGPTSTAGYRLFNALAVGLLGASLWATAQYLPDNAPELRPTLPWVQGAMGRLAFGQVILLVCLALCVAKLARDARKQAAQTGQAAQPAGYKPMLRGWLSAVVACLAQGLGLALSAGLALWVSDRLEGAATRPGETKSEVELRSPTLYSWIDVAALVCVAVVVLWVVFLLFRVLNQTQEKVCIIENEQQTGQTMLTYGANDKERTARAKTAARWWILAQSVETIPWMLAVLTGVGIAVTGVSAVAYGVGIQRREGSFLIDPDTSPHDWYPTTGFLSHLPSLGAWIITAGAGLLIAVAYAAYRNQSTRRIVGILWDVTTFWPKSNHPLTPASSAERAVPQLASRIWRLTQNKTDSLVLSAHSQGSILAAAAILRLRQDPRPERQACLPRVALLTYGSPLRRLYARAFPAYFSDQVLEQVQDNVDERWLNMWVYTDPIGADIGLTVPPRVRREHEANAGKPAELDWRLIPDPLTLDVDPRTGEQVAVCDHTGYAKRPEYPDAVEDMRQAIPPPEPTAPATASGCNLLSFGWLFRRK